MQNSKVNVPPCIAKILEDPELLKTHAKHVIRFIHQFSRDDLPKYIALLVQNGITINLDMECFEPFKCYEMGQLCESDVCPIRADIFNWIKSNVDEVYKVMDDDSVYLILKMNDEREIWLDLTSDKLSRSFTAQIAYYYNIVVDFDLRRKTDKERWIAFLGDLVERAKEVQPHEIDEDKEYVRKIALDYLYSVPVKPKDRWNGDVTSAVAIDGYAYFPKDFLRTYVSTQIGRRVSLKELTQLLYPEVQSVWMNLDGSYKAYYKYKLSEKQVKMLKEYEEIKEVKEVEEESEDEEIGQENEQNEEYNNSSDEDFGDYSFDIDDMLG